MTTDADDSALRPIANDHIPSARSAVARETRTRAQITHANSVRQSRTQLLTRTGVVIAALLAGSALPMALAGVAAAAPPASNCPSVVFIGARGSGETASSSTQGLGTEVDQMARQLQTEVLPAGLGVQVRADRYRAVSTDVLAPSGGEEAALLVDPAAAVSLWEKNHLAVFLASINEGIRMAVAEVTATVQACPTSAIVLAGYSQGAMVMHQAELQMAASDRGMLAHIDGTILLADGDRSPYTRAAGRLGSSPAAGEGIRPYLHLVATRDVPLPASTVDICNDHDLICDFNLSSLLHYKKDLEVHADYREGSLPALAANWVGQLILRTHQTTTTNPEAAPPEGGSGGAGASPGSGSASPTPETLAETTGSVVHTWTDYMDAGGTEGPTIPSNTTVQIACKVTGFRVEDGNTWWYQIASSPWDDTYYASADAFYNNGQTSGSLLGTPFVDPAVPNCSTASEPPTETEAPPGTALAETTGSVVHTWTDYMDAGGTEGPTIPPNTTVQIACKVTGFRVEDGNTWWYQIASSPWDDTYYASADAFYNNGQTSGSLLGTPFVDPAVPDC